MQRTLTFIGLIALFAVGVLVLAGGVAIGSQTYRVPSDPTVAAALAGAIVALVVLTVIAGIGLAQAFGLLSKQIGRPLNPDDRPEIEKRMVSLVDRMGGASGKVLSRLGYGQNEPINPYTPSYSYKAERENVEARNFTIGFAVVMLGLLVYAAVSHWQSWMEGLHALSSPLKPVPNVEVPTWAIGAGLAVALIGATAAAGVGLSIWFYRTQEEKDKADKLKEPAWPAGEIALWEQQIRNAPKTFKEMTFLDKSLIALNVGLVLIMLGGIAAWVLPGMSTVAAVDRAANPTATPLPAASAGGVASAVPPELQKEIDALPKGDAANGEKIFKVQQPCHVCHIDQPLGPPLEGFGTRAATRKPGYTAEAYLYESITNPGAYVVQGFQDGIMPPNFKETLTPQDIADLVAYLLTVK